MINNLFFSIIRDFNKVEIKEFRKFLISPHYVNRTILINIFDEIIKNKELLKNFEYVKLLKRLSKNLKYSHSTIVQRLSLFNKLILKFFKIKAILNDNLESELLLNDYLFQNKYIDLLQKNLEITNNIILKSKKFSDKSFFNSFHYNVQMCDFITNNFRFVGIKSAEKLSRHLKVASLDLTLYSLIQKVNLFVYEVLSKVSCGNKSKLYISEYIRNSFKEFDKYYLQELSSNKKTIYNLYRALFYAYYGMKKMKYFIEYKQNVENALNDLTEETIYFHYNQIMSYCVMKARLGGDKDFYIRQQTEIMLKLIRSDYFNTHNKEYLHPTVYRNFLLSIYSINDYNLLKYFIDNSIEKLNLKDYNDMLNLGLTYYYYGTKNYDKALESINNIQDNTFIYRFDIRNFLLRIYYETGEDIKFIESMHNYKEIILRDLTLNKLLKNSLLKQLKYLNKLIILKNNSNLKNPTDAGFLENQINQEPSFTLKKWILEKISEIAKAQKGEKNAVVKKLRIK